MKKLKLIFISLSILMLFLFFVKIIINKPSNLNVITSNNNISSKNYNNLIDSLEINYPSSQKKYSHDSLPILYYHCVSDNIFGIDELFVSPSNFEKQMDYLSKSNYTVITFDEIKYISSIEKPIIITFDDGYENNYTEAYPILKKYNFKASIFITYNSIGKKNYLNKDQIKKMCDLINFQGHTNTHPDLRTLNKEQLIYEIIESQNNIKSLTGQKVNIFAYPIGYYNDEVLKITKENYDYAVTNQGGLFYPNSNNNFLIKRVYIQRDLEIDDFSNKIILGTF
jgi:peptidoglycan/xylan/chitin deacetylase (PgdA/CDA1 family)